MALTINWPSGIINVPKADLLLISAGPPEVRQLDLNAFRLELKDLEDSDDGMAFLRTHNHNPPVTVGGVVLSRTVEIINGYTVTFENGQYAVNLVGANSNVGDVTNVNQVSIRSQNSAGLQDLSTLLASAYNDKVAVDVIDGRAGTSTPLGTRSSPVNNFADAITIAETNGINTLQIIKSATVTSNDFSDGFTFEGDNPINVVLTLDPDANLNNTVFKNLTIQGTLDGNNTIRESVIGNLVYKNGVIFESALTGTISLSGVSQATILNCFSSIPGGLSTPVLDMGVDSSLALRNFSGGIKIANFAGASGQVSVDMNNGRVIFDSTVTGGTIYVRGTTNVEDNSTGTAVINTDGLLNRELVDANKDEIIRNVEDFNLI